MTTPPPRRQSAFLNWLLQAKWERRRTVLTVVLLLFWVIVLRTWPLDLHCRLSTAIGTLPRNLGLRKQWALGRNRKGRNLPSLRIGIA